MLDDVLDEVARESQGGSVSGGVEVDPLGMWVFDANDCLL